MMTDERLAELEGRLECPGLLVSEATELIAEVRRLRGALERIAGMAKQNLEAGHPTSWIGGSVGAESAADDMEEIAREALGR